MENFTLFKEVCVSTYERYQVAPKTESKPGGNQCRQHDNRVQVFWSSDYSSEQRMDMLLGCSFEYIDGLVQERRNLNALAM